MRGNRRLVAVAALVAATVVLGALAGDGDRAAAAAPGITLDSAKLTARWNESWVKGIVSFRGTATIPAEIRVSLRPVGGGRTAGAETFSLSEPGPFSGAIPLPARLMPGLYRLIVTGSSGDQPLVADHRDVRLKAPPEGIVDYAYISATQGGKRANTLNGRRLQIWARFHFVVAPAKGQRKKLRASWHSPDFKWHAEPHKTLKQNIDTWVIDTTGNGLMKGVWFCYLKSTSGYVVKRTRVRLR